MSYCVRVSLQIAIQKLIQPTTGINKSLHDTFLVLRKISGSKTYDPPEWDLYSSHHMSKWHRCSTRPRPAMGCHLRHSCSMKYSSLPETNIAPENGPKGNDYSNHPFSGAMLVSGRVAHTKSIKICFNAAVPQKRKISISCICISSWCKWELFKKTPASPQAAKTPAIIMVRNAKSTCRIEQQRGHI